MPSQSGHDSTYREFLHRKSQLGSGGGFAPEWLPPALFDFQAHLVDWALRRGRAAIFADCGLGKTPMQLVWAENVVRQTSGRVLILTPLAVGVQTLAEGEKFGVACVRSRDGAMPGRGARIIVANYELLHRFSPNDFTGLVCDESSILKHFSGATQKAVTRFSAKLPYRLLCTATAAPNDYTELGTSSEALGAMGYVDMLNRFYRNRGNTSDLKGRYRGFHAPKAWEGQQWRFKAHAEVPFWRWVASWARACRRPSDLGFEDRGFILPPLDERSHVVVSRRPPDGMLFTLPAHGLAEEREERRRTLSERCEMAAALVAHGRPAIVWCHLNSEGDRLERLIPDAVQITGSQPDEEKEERIAAFLTGDVRVLVTKPKIAGFGLNLQRCAHVVTFVSHSYESYYQAVRRCWRFGQTEPVRVDIISTEGETRVAANMARKAAAAADMFDRMVKHMHEATSARRQDSTGVMEVPKWLTTTS